MVFCTTPILHIQYNKKSDLKQVALKNVGTALFSRAVTRQVFSTLMSLTTVFGMGTGGSSSLLALTIKRKTTRLSDFSKVLAPLYFPGQSPAKYLRH